MKTIKTNATLNPATKQITTNIERFNIKNLYAIINQTAKTVIYATGTIGKGYTSVSGNIVTLEYNTTSMDASDVIQVIYEDGVTENGAQNVGNASIKFRDGFALGFDADVWEEMWSNQSSSFRFIGGNSSGASYLGISMSPSQTDSEYTLTSKQIFRMPIRFGYGLSISQRIIGQEVEISLVGCDINGNIEYNEAIPSLAISGSITITSNVATINFDSAHNLKGNNRVVLVGNTDPRLNVGPVLVTVVTPTQITVPLTLSNGTYTAGGTVVFADIFNNVKNAVGLIHETTTTTNASFATKRNGGTPISLNVTATTTAATQSTTSPYSEAFRSAGDNEIISTMEQVKYVTRSSSSVSGASGSKWTETLPDEDKFYKIRLRVRNLPNLTVIGAKITSIEKTGTTIATVTTDVAHGLTASDYINIWGVRDQTNFPNRTTATAVSSIINSTQFTIVIGTASTVSSTGGIISRVQGGINLPGGLNFSVQSIVASNNVLTATLNTTASGVLVGEIIELVGMDNAGSYDGAYIVRRLNASTLELQKLSGTIADTVSTNTGGAVVKRTDIRLHYSRVLEYTRHLVELSNNRGVTDGSEGIPVAVTSGVITTVTASNAGIPFIVGDITSASLTTTTTTSSVTPSYGTSYIVSIPVTAVSGTNPTLDVVVQESDDTGTNWNDVFHFPRITATGIYRTPMLTLRGNRIRYIQTVTGTSASFTRAINRLQTNTFQTGVRQIFDRSISLTTLNATSSVLNTGDAQNVQMVINIGSATTAPTLQIEGSDDNLNWYTISSTLTAVANSTVQISVPNFSSKVVRAKVTGAGSSVTAGYILIKTF